MGTQKYLLVMANCFILLFIWETEMKYIYEIFLRTELRAYITS